MITPDEEWLFLWARVITTGSIFQPANIMFAAVELDLFAHLPEGGATAGEVAAAVGISPFSARLLLNALSSLGILLYDEPRYSVPVEILSFLSPGPATMLPSMRRFAYENGVWLRMAKILRDEENAPDDYGDEFLNNYSDKYPGLKLFNRYCAGKVVAANQEIVRSATRILDLGGGDGVFAGWALEMNPGASYLLVELANGVKCHVDLAKYIESGRLEFQVGDARNFEHEPVFDLVVMNELTELFTKEEKALVVRRALNVLAPGGHLIAIKFSLEPDGVQPGSIAMLSLRLSLMRPGVYLETDEELGQIFRDAGFETVAVQQVDLVKPTEEGTGRIKKCVAIGRKGA
jgi:SAM-dependent methyltransferase